MIPPGALLTSLIGVWNNRCRTSQGGVLHEECSRAILLTSSCQTSSLMIKPIQLTQSRGVGNDRRRTSQEGSAPSPYVR